MSGARWVPSAAGRTSRLSPPVGRNQWISNPAFDNWVKGRTPQKRWGKPEELVGAAVFLASAASDYVNGQIIYVDGGMISVL